MGTDISKQSNIGPAANDPEDEVLWKAHERLRRIQARSWGEAPKEECTLEAVLGLVSEEVGSICRTDEGWIRDGVVYHPVSESRRWQLTEEIIERTDPGPHEDAELLLRIARQAATIEMEAIATTRDLDRRVDPWLTVTGVKAGMLGEHEVRLRGVLSRTILGTSSSNFAHVRTIHEDDANVVVFTRGVFGLLFQTIRVCVDAMPLVGNHENPGLLAPPVESAGERAVWDPVFDALSDMVFEGRVVFPAYSPAESVRRRAFKTMSELGERFLVAHEYGHVLIDAVPFISDAGRMGAHPSDEWEMEYRADRMGFSMTSWSARSVDGLSVAEAFNAACLTMRMNQLLDDTVSVVQFGATATEQSYQSHPPFESRVNALFRFADLTGDSHVLEGQRRWAEALIDFVDALWRELEPRFANQFRAGRRLHPSWEFRS